MKGIDKEKLIRILNASKQTTLFENELKSILEEYGNDWFVVDREWTLTKVNNKDVD